ncbi:MAG: ABC transporter ATP-binding protein [Bacillota bacterium]
MSVPALVVEDLRKEFRSKPKRSLFKAFRKSRQPENGAAAGANGGNGADGAKTVVAVDGVSFSVPQGEVFGLLGPNGAGKTTTIKMLSTLLRPTSGRVVIQGLDVDKEPAKVLSRIGTVLSGERCVYWKLTGRENLQYFGALYGLSGPRLTKKIDDLLGRFQLTQRADETVEKYSTGMKRRITLARALLHDPEVLVLDEPTAGLDPQAARNLRELVLELKGEGKTVLLTTHYMEEADLLADRVAIIDHGKVIALDSPDHLKRELRQVKVVELEAGEWRDELGQTLKAAGLITSWTAERPSDGETWRVVIHLPLEVSVGTVIKAYLEQGNSVQNLTVKEASLEDVFIQLTGKSLRD